MNDNLLIGIIGVKNSGKDTVGSYLIENYGFTRYAFGDPVKQICKNLFSLSEEQLDRKLKETIDPRWDISPRQMFQKIGTEFGQFEIFKLFPELKNKMKYRELWVKLFNEWLINNEDKKRVVITDVRFKHEANFIKEKGGIIIKIRRNKDLPDNHLSELELNQIPNELIDFDIDNNYELVDLYSQIDIIISVPF